MSEQAISTRLKMWRLRPLPIALAHRFCSVNFGDPKMETLISLYRSLSAPDQDLCKTEFVRVLPLEQDCGIGA